MNIVLDEAVEEKEGGEKVRLGMVVCTIQGSFRRLVCSRGLLTFYRSSEETRWSCWRLWNASAATTDNTDRAGARVGRHQSDLLLLVWRFRYKGTMLIRKENVGTEIYRVFNVLGR